MSRLGPYLHEIRPTLALALPITFAAYWLVALPLAYQLGVRGPFDAVGIWLANATGLAFAAVFLALRFARLTR